MDLGLHYWNFSEPPDVAKIATIRGDGRTR
jgi:hypothetical protein